MNKKTKEAINDTISKTNNISDLVLLRLHPAKLLLLGYLSYMVIGLILLSLPMSQTTDVSVIDNLFIATSAVSTTGLVSIDPATSYSFIGELIILLLIQVGGLGYMTIGSFAALALHQRLSAAREKATKAAFNLPSDINVRSFIKSVVIFTLCCELIGAASIYIMLYQEGVENPIWSAIFHSISAFCTAGFSLNSDSFESFRGHSGINIVISLLSLLGAMGFLIVVDGWRTMIGQKRCLGFTSKVILRITMAFLLIGTTILFVVEPSLQSLEPKERLLASFFQTMTASTTVGFNTQPIGSMALGSLILLYFLMIIGASPAGTGGGLKTTSFAALVGLVRSTLKGRDKIRFFKRVVPQSRLNTAAASLAYFIALMIFAVFLLSLTEQGAAFEVLLFEAISAMGTVGLSMGITGNLTDLGKIIIILLMTAGRVGILTFGIALAAQDETLEQQQDNELVL